MPRDPIDFFLVRPEHVEVHAALCNWARWCSPGRGTTGVHPMFREYRDGYHEATAKPAECDTLSALATQRAYIQIPEIYRWVLNWAYIRPYIPVIKVRQALGLTSPGLAASIHTGRTMMKNRSAE